MAFAFKGKQLEHLETKEKLCVHRLKSLNALNVREYKNFDGKKTTVCAIT